MNADGETIRLPINKTGKSVSPVLGFAKSDDSEHSAGSRGHGSAHDLSWLIDGDLPIVRVRYELEEKNFTLDTVMDRHAQVLRL